MNAFTIPALLVAVIFPSAAFAGSVGGARSGQTSLGIDCDRRERFINCTELEKSHVLDKCYVVVHEQRRNDCTWQSCGFVSVVQKRPRLVNNEIDEYGIKTNISQYRSGSGSLPDDWRRNASGFAPNEIVPKSPYPRHYLTVREALELRKTSDGSSAAERIRSVPQDVIDSNPYLECAARTGPVSEETYVMLYKGTLGSSSQVLSVKVPKKDVADACDKLKLIESSGSCVVGASSFRPDDSVPIATFLAQSSKAGTASPAAPGQTGAGAAAMSAASPSAPKATVPSSQSVQSPQPAAPLKCSPITESRIRFQAASVPKGSICKSQSQTRSRSCSIRGGRETYSLWSDWSPNSFTFVSCSVRR